MSDPRVILSYAPVERPRHGRLSDTVDAVVGVLCTVFMLGFFAVLIGHFVNR